MYRVVCEELVVCECVCVCGYINLSNAEEVFGGFPVWDDSFKWLKVYEMYPRLLCNVIISNIIIF